MKVNSLRSRENRDQGAFTHPFPYSPNTTPFVWMHQAGTVYAGNKMVTLNNVISGLGSHLQFSSIRGKRHTASVLSAACPASHCSPVSGDGVAFENRSGTSWREWHLPTDFKTERSQLTGRRGPPHLLTKSVCKGPWPGGTLTHPRR